MRAPPTCRALCAAAALIGALAGVRIAEAQGPAEPTAIQVGLNEQAYAAFAEGNFAKAARLYRASLDLGPLNLTWANYGYAIFKLGRCEEAEAAYREALDAPRLAEPHPDEVAAGVAVYREELERHCAAVTVTCPEGVDAFALGDGRSRPCGVALWLSPGSHAASAEAGGGRLAANLEVRSGVAMEVALVAPAEVVPARPDPEGEGAWVGTAGLISACVGGAALLTGGVLEVAVLQPGLDELEATADPALFAERREALAGQQALVKGLVIGGAALAATGITLIMLDGGEPEPEGLTLRPWWSGQMAGVDLRW